MVYLHTTASRSAETARGPLLAKVQKEKEVAGSPAVGARNYPRGAEGEDELTKRSVAAVSERSHRPILDLGCPGRGTARGESRPNFPTPSRWSTSPCRLL